MNTIGSLCSGAGGLDMAVETIFGAETAWHCELDAAASEVLINRWPGVPNHRDLIGTDWNAVEPIDILCAGWPCQPFSLAGKQLGAQDERAIWPHIADAVRLLRPRVIVLENVSAVLRVEFGRVADSLAALGYDLRWTCLRASDVGAPHRRERLFVVAYADGGRFAKQSQRHSQPQQSQFATPQRGDVGGCGVVVADTACDRRYEGWPEPARLVGRPDVAFGGGAVVNLLQTPSVADALGGHLTRSGARGSEPLLPGQAREMAQSWGKYGAAIARWEDATRPAPPPTELNRAGNPRLSPAFSEWLMGWPKGWVTDVPGISRNDQLRIIGNGVVPQCAASALTSLLSSLELL